MKPLTYVLDANILVKWANAFTPEARQIDFHIKDFCESNVNSIVVPDLVWTEFLSVILHKEIYVGGSYPDTLLWLRNRQSLVQKIEYTIKSRDNWELNFELEINPFADAQELLLDLALIDEDTFDWMEKSVARKNRTYWKNRQRFTEKLLDGMDSVILIYLNELALQKQETEVVLYTADYPLWKVFERVKKHHRGWFAQNTSSVCALFPDVICKRCNKSYDRSILTKDEIRFLKLSTHA